jgi:hypothetical protein
VIRAAGDPHAALGQGWLVPLAVALAAAYL